MAKDNNTINESPIIDTTTSYSDPLYDRLESAKNQMAKRWGLLVIVAIVAAVVVVNVQQSFNTSPAAASAAAYNQAIMSSSTDDSTAALQALVDNPEITHEFRVRAGIDLAIEQQNNDQLDQALETLTGLEAIAQQSAQPGVVMSLQLSIAGVMEQQGQLMKAQSRFAQIAQEARTSHPAHALTADLGHSRILLQQALSKVTDDATNEIEQQEALALRKEALAILESIANRRLTGAERAIEFAQFQALNLKREYPELPLPITDTKKRHDVLIDSFWCRINIL